MNDDRDFERTTAEWLDTGMDSTPPHVINAVLLAARVTPQERDLRVPWRTSAMTAYLRIAAVIAIVAVAGAAALYAFGAGPNLGTGPTPSTNTEPTTAQPTPAASASPIDTAGWVTYVSDRYGFSIGHPAGWTEMPAERSWTLEEDAEGAADDWLSPGADAFVGDNVRVSAWSVPIDRDTTPETVAGVEAWVTDYCERTSGTSCEGIFDRATLLCVEVRDCHPGLLVQFPSETVAFFTGGIYGDTMTVVAVWWGESEPATASFGGSQKLLEAFLSTMDVWTDEAAEGQR